MTYNQCQKLYLWFNHAADKQTSKETEKYSNNQIKSTIKQIHKYKPRENRHNVRCCAFTSIMQLINKQVNKQKNAVLNKVNKQ